MRALLAIAVVAVLAALAFLVWPRGSEQAPGGAGADVPGPSLQAQVPRELDVPVAEAATESARAEVAGPSPVHVAQAADARHWFVRGVVHGVPEGSESPARLRARFFGAYNIEDEVEADVGPDGRVDLELTPALQTWLRHVDPEELRLEVELPTAMPGLVRLPFASAAPDPLDPAARVFAFELELLPAAVVTGRVIAPAGPAAAALYDRANAAGAQETPRATAECTADGRFTLRVQRGGPWLLVVLADRALTSTRTLELPLGRITDVGTIELAAGAEIEGEVRHGGVPVGRGFVIEARLAERPRDARELGGVLREGYLIELAGGGYLAHRRLAETDGEGRFRIEGLAELEYDLEVIGRPDVRMGLGGPSVTERVVRAPRAGVVLTGVPPRLEVRATFAGRTPQPGELEGAKAGLIDLVEGHAIAQLDLSRAEEGYGGVRVLPGVSYGLVVARGRFAERTLAVGTFAPGEEREVVLDLQPGPQPATLRVRLVAPHGESPRRSQFALQDLADDAASVTWDEVERGEAGSFDFEGLPAGPLRVIVRPHSRWEDLEPTGWLDDAFEVTLAPGATVERELVLREGGRIRVAVRDEDGAFVRTPVELHDGAGRKLATEFYCRLPGLLQGCGWYLCEQGINDHPPLAPGRYTLTLRPEGLAEQVVPFDLAQGETRLIEATVRL